MICASPKDFIPRAARRHPDKTAVISDGRTVSYAALHGMIGRLGRALKTAGVGNGDTVALVLPNSLEFVVAFYATLQAGAIVFPLSPKLAACELAGLLADAAADCVLGPGDLSQILAPLKAAGVRVALRLDFNESELRTEPLPINNGPKAAQAPARRTTRGRVAARQYSSGSTGAPKHMLKTTRNLSHDAWRFAAALGLTEEEIFFGVAPFCHAYGLLSLLASGSLGATLVVVKQFLPHGVLDHIARDRATVCLATPAMLEILADCYLETTPSLESLRYCVSSTAPLSKAVHQRFQRRFAVPVFQQYGSTETGSSAIYRVTDCADESFMGMPMPGVSVQVFDEEFKPMGSGQVGRVGIKSPAACDRYLNNAEATAKTFRAGYVFPGDLGYLDAAGALHIVGRDNVINVGGLKVDAIEVEKVLRSHPAVSESLVCGLPDGHTQTLHAIVVSPGGDLTDAELWDYCRARLSDYKVPKVIHRVEKLPRDDNGKILRKKIEDCIRQTGRG